MQMTPNELERNVLTTKHPPSPSDRRHSPSLMVALLQCNQHHLVLRSFKPSYAGGPDGLKPEHILDMVQGDVSSSLLSVLLDFVNMVLAGGVFKHHLGNTTPYFFGVVFPYLFVHIYLVRTSMHHL